MSSDTRYAAIILTTATYYHSTSESLCRGMNHMVVEFKGFVTWPMTSPVDIRHLKKCPTVLQVCLRE